jgi:hypothetical protein
MGENLQTQTSKAHRGARKKEGTWRARPEFIYVGPRTTIPEAGILNLGWWPLHIGTPWRSLTSHDSGALALDSHRISEALYLRGRASLS